MAPTRHSSSSSGHDGIHSLDPSTAPGFRSLKDQGSPPPSTPEALEAIFPPIGDYAFLSDCENTLLVAPTGSIEWMCLPKPHDPSLFGTILDRSAGSFRLAPVEKLGARAPSVPAGNDGVVHDLADAQRLARSQRLLGHRAVVPNRRTFDAQRRTPGDSDARHVLVRTAKCLHGSVDVILNCEPSFNYGHVDAEWEYTGTSYDHVSTTNADYNRITVTGDMRFGIEGRAIRARHRLVEGESCFVVLSWTDAPLPTTQEEVDLFKSETSRFWRGWIDGGQFPDHPWREFLQRSALTLKGLSYAPTGAILAAPTTSLPENLGGSRNWDYRYTWIRDTAFALRALHALGFHTEADDFLAFLGDVLEPPRGTAAAGYGPGETCRCSIPWTAATAARRSRTRPPDGLRLEPTGPRSATAPTTRRSSTSWAAMVDCSLRAHPFARRPERACVAHRGPGRRDGPGVLARSGPRHLGGARRAATLHVSKVMCWVAADRGARLARLRGEKAPRRTVAARGPGSTPTSARNGVDESRLLHAALRERRTRRVTAADAAAAGSCPPMTNESARRCSRSPTS